MKTLPILSFLAATSAFALSLLNLEAAALLLSISGVAAILAADYGRTLNRFDPMAAAPVPAHTKAATETLGLAA